MTGQSTSFRVPQQSPIGNNRERGSWPVRVVALALNDPTVIVVGAVGIIVVLGTALSLSRAGTLHDEIGGDGLVERVNECRDALPAALEEERTEEIRQLIQARSDRRVRQGLEPLDVDGEIERLLAAERGPGRA